jgi:hypothetical protein
VIAKTPSSVILFCKHLRSFQPAPALSSASCFRTALTTLSMFGPPHISHLSPGLPLLSVHFDNDISHKERMLLTPESQRNWCSLLRAALLRSPLAALPASTITHPGPPTALVITLIVICSFAEAPIEAFAIIVGIEGIGEALPKTLLESPVETISVYRTDVGKFDAQHNQAREYESLFHLFPLP